MLWTADSFDPKGAGACWVYLYCKKKMRSEGSHSHPAAKGVASVSLFYLLFYSGEVQASRGCPRGFRGFGAAWSGCDDGAAHTLLDRSYHIRKPPVILPTQFVKKNLEVTDD